MGAGDYQPAGATAPPSYAPTYDAPPSYEPAGNPQPQQHHHEQQQQASYGATVMTEQTNVHVHVHDDDQQQAVLINIVILIVGVFCCPVWLAGWMYKDHKDETVRLLAKINLILFFLALAIVLCFVGTTLVFVIVWLLFIVIVAIIGALAVT